MTQPVTLDIFSWEPTRHSLSIFLTYKMFSYNKEKKVLSGPEIPQFYERNVSLGQVILHYLQRDPTKIVQTCFDDGVELSGEEMAKLATRIAGNLKHEGMQLGDVIGLVAKNTTYVAPAFLACCFIGCPVSTVDPTFDVSEVANIFRQSKPKMVFCDHDNWRSVTEALQQCNNKSETLTVDEKLIGM